MSKYSIKDLFRHCADHRADDLRDIVALLQSMHRHVPSSRRIGSLAGRMADGGFSFSGLDGLQNHLRDLVHMARLMQVDTDVRTAFKDFLSEQRIMALHEEDFYLTSLYEKYWNCDVPAPCLQ